MTHSNKIRKALIDAGLIALLLLLFIIALWYLPNKHIAYSLVLLVGVWWLDVYLKRLLELGNGTALADLSFAAIAFAAGPTLGLFLSDGTHGQFTVVFEAVPLTFAVVLTWLGNLSICRSLEAHEVMAAPHIRFLFWGIAVLFATISVIAALNVSELLNF